MGIVKRVAAVVVPLGLVVGGVWYGVSRHDSGDDKTLGECTTKVGRLTVVLTDEQARNASLISAIAIRRGMPAHAATIGLATALQESKLYNLRGGDRDSLGLFQQRHSQGWGTPEQILDPVYATNAFYDALTKVPNWASLPVTEAAQEVQRSGYPSAYAVYEGDARALASALTGYSPASFWCHLPRPRAAPPPATRRAVGLRESLAPAFGPVEVRVGSGNRIELAASSPARGWAVASYLVAHAAQLGISTVGFRDREWSVESNRGWRHASDSATADSVVIG
ncbi:MAG TPA: hypothetical protein VHR85_03965 [Nocardioides sp.]|jgi:hypothetical protein|nr:hypothetical protein [Nocardioides sp.]